MHSLSMSRVPEREQEHEQDKVYDSKRRHIFPKIAAAFPQKKRKRPGHKMRLKRLRKDCPTFAVTADSPFPQWLRARSLERGSVFQ